MPVRGKPVKLPVAETGFMPPLVRALPARGSQPIMLPWSDIDVRTSHGRIKVRMGRGNGVPLLFLHGGSFSMDVFAGQMSRGVSEGCRLVALDLPGHGASEDAGDPARTYSIPGYADAVIETLEQLDLQHVALCGWSLGGHVAIEIASRFPNVLGLMLCGTPPVGVPADAAMAGFNPGQPLGVLGEAAMTPADVRAFGRLTVGEAHGSAAPAAIMRTDRRARALTYAHLFADGVPNQRAFLESTEIPVAVVNGADDPVVDVAYLRRVRYSSLWYRRLHLIPNGGHAPFLLQPEAFDKVLARFLRSMRRRHERAVRNPDLCFSG